MILTAAMEFHPANSKMVKDRPSDDAELNEVCVCVCVCEHRCADDRYQTLNINTVRGM